MAGRDYSVVVDTSGPLFDGSARDAILGAQEEAGLRVAQAIRDDIADEVRTRAKHPTGNYDRHLVVNRAGATLVISDSDIIYGPWLEGVAGRNHRSRFKGFQMFRRARQAYLSGGAGQEIVAEVVAERLAKVGAT